MNLKIYLTIRFRLLNIILKKINYYQNFSFMLPNKIQNLKEESNKLSQEVIEILNILDNIESHTAELRKKIVVEISSQQKTNNVHLDLDKVESND